MRIRTGARGASDKCSLGRGHLPISEDGLVGIMSSLHMLLPYVFLLTAGISTLLLQRVEPKYVKRQEIQWEHQETLFAKLTDHKLYNSRLRPYANKDIPVRVNTSIYVYSMASIDELHTEYTMQMLYRQTWIDRRLQFPANSKVERIVGDHWHVDRIWFPAVHVVNNKDIGSFSADSEGTVLLHIDPDGRVLLSKRVKLRPLCKMEFYRYPMDKQQCKLEIESSTLSDDDLELNWSTEQPLDLNNNFFLTGFLLTNYTLEKTVAHYWQTGNFSRLIVNFDLQREFGHFLLDIYIPGILFVVTSWMSFWVEIPAAPARVTLGITTMLTLVTSEKAIREKLPKVSYVHALDVWNVVCTGFIFASLVEYALVNYIYHKDKRRKRGGGMKRVESTATFASMDSDSGSLFSIFSKKEPPPPNEAGMPSKKAASFASLADLQSLSQFGDMTCPWPLDEIKLTPQDIANGIDRKCRIIFPTGFILFNIIYWLVLYF